MGHYNNICRQNMENVCLGVGFFFVLQPAFIANFLAKFQFITHKITTAIRRGLNNTKYNILVHRAIIAQR